ncbi:hypothetical protein FDH38_gp009 [Dinoroseobacter phage vB_DshS-R5C]|uniref:Uncharacterized protein n=1 Tax=Dinoroseobacter phage vB_DshS-R5C TaxID=1965368 RepID=A0A1V0DY41_9CAUD|nr:hypothetical protein FDH38_gp009 [Dinoroseobacter phage vB_DshS-R5C]ARB06063.1 hypothetical protein vBDshSR5C_9 [Dinoroseobacter phage vB_DshS-R5C]
MPEFHPEWEMREELTQTVDLWVARPGAEKLRKRMMSEVQKYCDEVGLCVTVTSTRFVFTGGYEMGYRVGLRNYPRFPVDCTTELLGHAERIGMRMAQVGEQGSFMIEEVGQTTYWFTRRLNDGESPQGMAECDCQQQSVCARVGCVERGWKGD